MSVKFLKSIREIERDCEQRVKNTESKSNNEIMEAEKKAVLKLRDTEIQAKEEANKILSGVKERVEKEYVKMLNIFEEDQNELKTKAKKLEKEAIDLILSKVL